MKSKPSLPRRLVRRGWQILLLTLVVSAPVAYLIFQFIEPTYRASSMIRVEPPAPNLYAPKLSESNGSFSYLQTQVHLILSDKVLGAALASPTVSTIFAIKKSEDPMNDLRAKLSVGFVDDSYLIRIAFESKVPTEAAAIVNAVVEAYRLHNEEYATRANKRLRESLERERDTLKIQIDSIHQKLLALVQTGRVGAAEPSLNQRESLQSSIYSQEAAILQSRHVTVSNYLAQLEFESKQESFRIVLVDPATVPVTPVINNRLKYMAATPVIVFFLIFSWFVSLEIGARRLARSEKLSSARLRAEAADLLEGEYVEFKR